MGNKREKNLWQRVKKRIAALLLAGATALGGYALINQGTENQISANDGSNEPKQNEQVKGAKETEKYKISYEITPTMQTNTSALDKADNFQELKEAMLKDIKENYIKQYNEQNETDYRPEDISFYTSVQDNIYKTEDGTYITHGENPTATMQELKNRGIDFTIINNVPSYIAFLKTPEGNEVLEQIGIVDFNAVPLNSNNKKSPSLEKYYRQIETAVKTGIGEHSTLAGARTAYYEIKENIDNIDDRAI